jgi:glyoxylase-like metal-dependent hydrolase (beta-lactamase superfamily II)
MTRGIKTARAAAGLVILLLALGPLISLQAGGAGEPSVASISAGMVGAKLTAAADAGPNYTIRAIRYATVPKFPLAGLVMGAPKDELIDIAMVFWVIQGGGHTILFDSGFHREKWFKDFQITDYMAPDKLVEQAGIPASSVTDIIVSHAHWDHMGGIDLFPKATIWIQKQEYEYYTGAAWQPGGQHGGIDPDDVEELVRRNTRGQLRFVNGDDVEILPGIRAYSGSRHTFASQYIRVGGEPPYVLASDNCYLYENLRSHRASATFDPADEPGNIAAQQRMIALAGSVDRVVPGHDPAQFERFPTTGRVARIR